MNSFEELFVNSTNRISSTKNLVLTSRHSTDTTVSTCHGHNHHTHNKNALFKVSCAIEGPSESFEELQMRYQELSKTVKQANKQRQMMQELFEMIFKVQQGAEQKMKKRIRRKKDEVQAKYECMQTNCKKAYSSSASLVRHSKLKHAYSKFEPPSHNYQIPPSPNLNNTSVQNRPSDMKQTLEKQGEDSEEEGAAAINQLTNSEEHYEADWEHSQGESEREDEDSERA